MSLIQQHLINYDHDWLESQLKAALDSTVVAAPLERVSDEALNREAADRSFLTQLSAARALLVGNVAKLVGPFMEDQRIRRDLRISGIGHRELARGIMTLKLRRLNHDGRLLNKESELSPKPKEADK